MVINAPQLNSTKPELRFSVGSSPGCGVPEIRGGEDLWQWPRLEIRLNAFRRSIIPRNNLSPYHFSRKNRETLNTDFFHAVLWMSKISKTGIEISYSFVLSCVELRITQKYAETMFMKNFFTKKLVQKLAFTWW